MTEEISFGRWLSARRHLLNLTQDELARRVGCSVVTIRKVESDERRPSKQIAERLAASLDIPPAERVTFIAFSRSDLDTTLTTLPTPSAPMPASRANARTNLPTPLTRLIGRDHDLAAVRNRLRHEGERLLTLIGPPGIGKTRLALAVAAKARDTFADGVYFVALAPISDPNLVIATIAQALDIKEIGGRALEDQLRDVLRAQQLLLVLDNCEQVLGAAPQVAELLSACPHLQVLTTSRAALRVRGERLYSVPPLLLPDLDQLPPVSALVRIPAIALFVDRAQAIQPDFGLTDENAAAVAAICAGLDGLPLAIELVAARVQLLSPQELLSQLTSRLELLTDGPRDLPLRQQTLRSAIAWSYDLLDEAEQALLARLGVFVGGWELEAAETICGISGGYAVLNNMTVGTTMLDGLRSLVDKSLLREESGPNGQPRFSMLETIREYALEQLAQRGNLILIQQQHAVYFCVLAESAEPHLRSATQLAWVELLETEHANMRAALQWSLEQAGDLEIGFQLLGALGHFWWLRNHYTEGQRWATIGVARAAQATPVLRGRALEVASVCAYGLNHYDQSEHLATEAIDLWRTLGDPWHTAFGLRMLAASVQQRGNLLRTTVLLEESLKFARIAADPWLEALVLASLGRAIHRQDWNRSVALCEESLRLARAAGDRWVCCTAMNYLCSVGVGTDDLMKEQLQLARELGDRRMIAAGLLGLAMVAYFAEHDYQRAQELVEETIQVARANGERHILALALNRLGDYQRFQGHNRKALASFEESEALCRAVGDSDNLKWVLHNLGHVTLHEGAYAQATSYFTESLSVTSEDQRCIINCLVGFAGIAQLTGKAERAARLFGAIAATSDTPEQWFEPVDLVDYQRGLAAVRTQLGEEAFHAAAAEGRTLTLDQAVAYATEQA